MPTPANPSHRQELGLRYEFVGRRPVLDRHDLTVGYELALYTPHHRIVTPSVGSDRIDTWSDTSPPPDLAVDDLVGDKVAFIELAADSLLRPQGLEELPPDRVVLMITDDNTAAEQRPEVIRSLHALGYTLAVGGDATHAPAGPDDDLASIVTYEQGALDEEAFHRRIEIDHRAGRRVLLRGVDRLTDRIVAGQVGVDFVQGFHFTQPSTASTGRIPPNIAALVRMTAELNRPEATTAEIVDLLTQDVALSVRIVRVVNSASSGSFRRVESIHQAAILVGRTRLWAWAMLTMLATVDDRPAELITLALTRAKFCELVAVAEGRNNPEMYFTTGMLSLLEPMTGIPLDAMVHDMALDPAINDALIFGMGPLGGALELAIRMETGGYRNNDVPSADTVRRHHDAMAWSTAVSRAVV